MSNSDLLNHRLTERYIWRLWWLFTKLLVQLDILHIPKGLEWFFFSCGHTLIIQITWSSIGVGIRRTKSFRFRHPWSQLESNQNGDNKCNERVDSQFISHTDKKGLAKSSYCYCQCHWTNKEERWSNWMILKIVVYFLFWPQRKICQTFAQPFPETIQTELQTAKRYLCNKTVGVICFLVVNLFRKLKGAIAVWIFNWKDDNLASSCEQSIQQSASV